MTRPDARAGFTLAEALIALSISSVLVLLVSAVYLVQNDFYSHMLLRTQVQENARAMSEFVAGEIRSVTKGGVITADSARLVVRANLALMVVCGSQGNDVMAHLPGGVAGVDTTTVSGFGHRDRLTGVWTYYDHTWGQIHASGGQPAVRCAQAGADTTGAATHFVRLAPIDNDTGISAGGLISSVLMLYRKSEFRFNDSQLVTGDRALFWGTSGQTLKELVTGMAPDAHFEYRTGTTWSKSVTGASLANITAIRVVARSIGRGETSGQLNYEFGWTVDVPLANAY